MNGAGQGPASDVAPHLLVAAVATRGDDLMLVRRGHGAAGHWDLPGGVLRGGETLAEAVVRLFGDQTGCTDVLCGPFIGWSELIDDDAVEDHRVVMYFNAVVIEPEPSGPASATEVRWTPVWTVPELPLQDGLAEFLSDQEIIETVV